MDTRNYASIEASHRLIEAGIALETEAYWESFWTDLKGKKIPRLIGKTYYSNGNIHSVSKEYAVPAPSMVEVWLKLIRVEDELQIDGELKIVQGEGVGETCCGFYDYSEDKWITCFSSFNPTDALIDLLIWVRKGSAIDAQEGEHE